MLSPLSSSPPSLGLQVGDFTRGIDLKRFGTLRCLDDVGHPDQTVAVSQKILGSTASHFSAGKPPTRKDYAALLCHLHGIDDVGQRIVLMLALMTLPDLISSDEASDVFRRWAAESHGTPRHSRVEFRLRASLSRMTLIVLLASNELG